MKIPPALTIEPNPGHDDADSCLSAFLDGEAAAADSACSRWRDDAAARRTWHTYNLIGDVLRSEELAASPARDAAFLSSLRVRLLAEPVVLAPTPASTPARSRQHQRWLMPVVAAAGFVVVAGVLVMVRSAAPDATPDAVPMQLASEAAAPGPRASAVLVTNRQPPAVPDLRDLALIRDPRLDEYLRAHQAAGGLAVATPGGWLRRVDAVVPQPLER